MTRSFALALVLLTAPVHAMRAETLPPPDFVGEPIQRFFIVGPIVDGVPTYREQWRVFNGVEWVPLMSEEGQAEVFGIAPLIPRRVPGRKFKRRME